MSMKKVLSVVISFTLVLCSFSASFAVSAEDSVSGSVSFLNYNVAGLPDISSLTGGEGKDVPACQTAVGNIFNESGFDIIAVQEDFNYHDSLVAPMTAYAYKTYHIGGVPVGDGMNVFSKYPIYNTARTEWEQRYGVVNDGADELTPKGILYTVIELADGVYVDFYDIHADAYGDAGSNAARKDNFRQLAEMINARTVDRPVIVTGDFNSYIHNNLNDDLYAQLVEGVGLKDAWVEFCNGGDYENFDSFIEQYGSRWEQSWGVWDSVERFMYKDGGGISLEVTDFRYICYKDDAGNSLSDHNASTATFAYTVDEASFVENTEPVKEEHVNQFKVIIQKIIYFFQTLIKVLGDIDSLKAYLGK